MGLPQASRDLTVETTTSLSTYVSIPQRGFGGIGTCDLDGLHGGSMNDRTARDFPCSSISDFQRKTSLDAPNGTDGPFKCKSAIDGVQGLEIQSKDKMGWLNPKIRVVGFESTQVDSSANKFEKVGLDGIALSVAGDASHNLTDPNGSSIRKRLHSPINGMLGKQFHGDLLELSVSEGRRDSFDPTRKHGIFALQDCKKVNTGTAECHEARRCPIFRCENRNKFTSGFFTDGPLLESSASVSSNCDPSKARTCGESICVSPKKVHSPPLSLSPLGPKWVDRMRNEMVCRDVSKEFESDYLTLNKFEGSESGNATRLAFTPDGGYRAGNTCGNTDILHDESELFTLFGPEFVATPRGNNKLVRNLRAIPVGRSLVGSFEESLLSGRFSSSKVNQIIDGFLAVLNVTGGSFSPPAQKLPFGVTSVEGDSSLLYYASIDLAGSLPSSKGRRPKLKRSLSNNDDSRAAKSRLRIPMKGCIQLVLSNPELTPLHTFFCNYDLNDMPAGTKTFMRRRVTLGSPSSGPNQVKDGMKDCDTKCGPTAAPILSGDDAYNVDVPSASRSTQEKNLLLLSTEDSLRQPNGCECQNFDKDRCGQLNKLHFTNTKDTGHGSPRGSSGALRYALHLRFLCPAPKKHLKSVQRCISDQFSVPSSNNLDNEGERRFYLYNDLRVVFPQRHSDADEGKLQVEHHFPADPKYFDIGN